MVMKLLVMMMVATIMPVMVIDEDTSAYGTGYDAKPSQESWQSWWATSLTTDRLCHAANMSRRPVHLNFLLRSRPKKCGIILALLCGTSASVVTKNWLPRLLVLAFRTSCVAFLKQVSACSRLTTGENPFTIVSKPQTLNYEEYTSSSEVP